MAKTKSTAKAEGATKGGEPIVAFENAQGWEAWLKANHARADAVFLRLTKGVPDALSYAQAIDAALAWGWIDSRKETLDEKFWLQRFSKRRAKSPWSKINRAKAEALIKAGRMQAPGLAEIERAKKDGRWKSAYEGARSARLPADLAAAFAANKKARAFYEALDGANRYAILWRVQQAKRPETRAERIKRFVAMCARGERIHEKK